MIVDKMMRLRFHLVFVLPEALFGDLACSFYAGTVIFLCAPESIRSVVNRSSEKSGW